MEVPILNEVHLCVARYNPSVEKTSANMRAALLRCPTLNPYSRGFRIIFVTEQFAGLVHGYSTYDFSFASFFLFLLLPYAIRIVAST
jgi:hypothetical protein